MAYGGGYAGGYGDVTGFQVTVQIAFASDPGDTPVWEDVSEYLERFTVHRGRADELSPFSAGTAQITLANEDRRFDPTYEDSPYWPNVVPMRRVRVRSAWEGVTYDVFNGYVSNWRQEYAHPEEAWAVVEATDAFKVLANAELPVSVYAATVAVDNPVHWWRLGEPSGSTTAFDVEGTNGTYVGGVSLGQAGAPTHDPDTAASFDGSGGHISFGSAPRVTGFPYSIELWLKISERTSTGNYFFYAQSSGLGSADPHGYVTGVDFGDPGKLVFDSVTSNVRVDDNAWHHVVLTASSSGAGAQTLWIDGLSQGTGTPSTPSGDHLLIGHPYIPGFFAISRHFWPGSVDELAIYNTALGSPQIAAHNTAGRTPWRADSTGERVERILDAAGWPAADRDIDAGQSPLQSADLGMNALAALQQVEQTEFGALFITGAGQVRFVDRLSLLSAPYTTSQADFGDDGSELEYADLTFEYDDQLIFNDALVSRSGGTVMSAFDATSQQRYLKRSKVVDGLLHQQDSMSLDIANWIVTHYKDPILRVTGLRLEPSAGNEATHFPQVLGRELLDRVTVNRRPQNLGVAISQESIIQGITHNVTAAEWVTTWNLSPADTQVYWILGTAGFSELGQTTRLGF